MTRGFVSVLVVSAAVGFAPPTWAQTPTPPPSPTTSQSPGAPSVNLWYVGGTGGVGDVDRVSGFGGGEAGFRIWKHLDVLAEAGYTSNLVTRRELAKASAVAGLIQSSQGGSVGSGVTVPTAYAAIGARWVFESISYKQFRPYVLLSAGGAEVNLKPTFSQNGANVTGSLPNFGITLGSDLSGKYRPFAFGGGLGAMRPCPWLNGWNLDVSVRFLSINTVGQKTNWTRLSFGIVRRF